jgi:hypothetical protein
MPWPLAATMYNGRTALTPKKASRSRASIILAIQKFQLIVPTWTRTLTVLPLA